MMKDSLMIKISLFLKLKTRMITLKFKELSKESKRRMQNYLKNSSITSRFYPIFKIKNYTYSWSEILKYSTKKYFKL